MAAHVLAVKDLTKILETDQGRVLAVDNMITLVLVFTASKLIGKNMADMFR